MDVFRKFKEMSDGNFGGDIELPKKSGWYWVLIYGYDNPTPCWYSYSKDESDCCFLPGGMGDSSSTGLYKIDISKVGSEIIVPIF